MSKLKPFGHNSDSHAHGFTLSCLISHLEALVEAESELIHGKSPRQRRLDLVESALWQLNEAAGNKPE